MVLKGKPENTDSYTVIKKDGKNIYISEEIMEEFKKKGIDTVTVTTENYMFSKVLTLRKEVGKTEDS